MESLLFILSRSKVTAYKTAAEFGGYRRNHIISNLVLSPVNGKVFRRHKRGLTGIDVGNRANKLITPSVIIRTIRPHSTGTTSPKQTTPKVTTPTVTTTKETTQKVTTTKETTQKVTTTKETTQKVTTTKETTTKVPTTKVITMKGTTPTKTQSKRPIVKRGNSKYKAKGKPGQTKIRSGKRWNDALSTIF
ncbi:uncharacterized protein LOC123548062 [Mercenaria mercenaria]|uniref:uncharacterized protein LOC123548062 n=1 Tax=Mercenaria mercenaria TaxID=6596 RepID=UPI00234EAD0A|nr:uncharacterized protein LOC123548062 [Mercenaria mercenaria]XP_053407547.1 uncharacterized protein LOC123548062 [Mercenaria mercenaria]XP_053407548.1 uncharacterized protein LOC123548062 [Mercenaria mercenaria]XP_053407549.1 uncharacterized protein LOC123548062 [Mercenaria mercenaria]XP_053407550.1 uncharacterized protein LOC123548062 [Mercenaria mercenaria]XP_053407551.1 uncharacterized protein LOC123548062 [Mercenaria mercenaria]XP_053407552.1 uncharacterized protein LOC123548062 [Mercen